MKYDLPIENIEPVNFNLERKIDLKNTPNMNLWEKLGLPDDITYE